MDVRPYDFNSWQDSPTAQGLAEKMGADEILLEGVCRDGYVSEFDGLYGWYACLQIHVYLINLRRLTDFGSCRS